MSFMEFSYCSVGSMDKLLDKHCPSQVDQNLDPPMCSLEGCHYVYTSQADRNRHKLVLHNGKRKANAADGDTHGSKIKTRAETA